MEAKYEQDNSAGTSRCALDILDVIAMSCISETTMSDKNKRNVDTSSSGLAGGRASTSIRVNLDRSSEYFFNDYNYILTIEDKAIAR
uniref:Uncharacterized protein n=1 Tax=Vespula pensylvanica TaxID=30213 RepID=A0A834P3A0_VESPE|nr:hypothetical protein H0235_006580 [Vespula pensylvanica]